MRADCSPRKKKRKQKYKGINTPKLAFILNRCSDFSWIKTMILSVLLIYSNLQNLSHLLQMSFAFLTGAKNVSVYDFIPGVNVCPDLNVLQLNIQKFFMRLFFQFLLIHCAQVLQLFSSYTYLTVFLSWTFFIRMNIIFCQLLRKKECQFKNSCICNLRRKYANRHCNFSRYVFLWNTIAHQCSRQWFLGI